METKNLTLTPTDLKDIISGAVKVAIEESRKVVPSEAELKATETAQRDRREQASQVLEDIERKKWEQRTCSHFHSAASAYGARSHAVYITNGNYLLCQKCNAKVRGEVAPEGYKGTDIYDIALFNSLFQASNDNAMIG